VDYDLLGFLTIALRAPRRSCRPNGTLYRLVPVGQCAVFEVHEDTVPWELRVCSVWTGRHYTKGVCYRLKDGVWMKRCN
jgi:hypothetical protein